VAACLLVGCTGPTTSPTSPPPKALSIRKVEPDAEVYKGILKGLGIEPVTFRCTSEGGPLAYKVEIEDTGGTGQKPEGSFGVVGGEATISFAILPPSTGSKVTKIIVQHITKSGSGATTFGLETSLWFDWKGRSVGVEMPVGDQPVTIEMGKEITLLRYEAREMVPTQGKEAPKQEPRVIRLTFSVWVGDNPGTAKK
jgi:hypothetical protein